jgi:hypothetical protein
MPPRIFLSHASDDKADLAPLFSELARRQLPLFVDQKHNVPWQTDIRSGAVDDDDLVESMGPGSVPERLKGPIRDCGLFVVAYTEGSKDRPGVWEEVKMYLMRREMVREAPPPPPLLIQAQPLASRVTIPDLGYLLPDLPNVVRFGQLDWADPAHVHDLADVIEAEYAAHHHAALADRHRARQRAAAAAFAGGRLTTQHRLAGGEPVEMAFIPVRADARRGHYVTVLPMTPAGPHDAPIGENGAMRAAGRAPPLRPIAAQDIAEIFPIRLKDGSLASPFGPASRRRSDPFWVVGGDGLVAVDSRGRAVSAAKAYLYLKG